MSDLRTANIRHTLNDLGVQIEELLREKPATPTLDRACPFCGAPVDRDIDGQYECGTGFGESNENRTADCFMAEIEDLRSRPIASTKLHELLDWLELFDKHLNGILGPSQTYQQKQGVLARVADKVNNMITVCEADNG
jgi:hypothetical protein